jgi:putative acetyltransferase
MITFKRTNSLDPAFIQLVKHLDAELAIIDGEDHSFYNQFNKLHNIRYVILAFDTKTAVGCGAIKVYNSATMEVKRMYVADGHRGKGIGAGIMIELEKWAKELGFSRCILETGTRQEAAILLYKKTGYRIIPNYGQYAGVENSLCFEKVI